MAALKRVKEEVAGVVSISGSLYLGLCLLSYDKWDPSFFTYSTSEVKNLGGIVGAYLSDGFMSLFGMPSYVLPVFLFVYGLKCLFSKERHRVHLLGAALFIVSAAVLSTLIKTSFDIQNDAGGVVGRLTGGLFIKGLSIVGAYIVALAAFFSSLILLSPVSLLDKLVGRAPARTSPELSPVPPPEAVEEEGFSMFELEEFRPEYEEPLPFRPPQSSAAPERRPAGAFELPPVELLSLYEGVSRSGKDEFNAASLLLERKLSDYGIQGRVSHVHTGPVITMYEFEPAPGTKINRVTSLADDLALALKAQSVRISPVHGKAAIGVEIPNRQREIVSLREIISSESFRKNTSKLALAFGKDIFGNAVVADLSRMPHLLVAGATGSGKSVFLNSLVVSMLYRATPSEVKMLLIDPKLLELSSYDGIPHLIAPVITSPKEAAEMLKNMVFEMERRYRLIAEKGVRNIESFNAVAPEEESLPYIIIFIDELADLMFASASQVEDSIARLAQMARAAGMHLILATQRPSVDVITGVIKANFPARVAFQVISKIDSRTIIDTMGAEQLIGRGDMLFMLPGLRITRVHGALVTEGEVKAVAGFIQAQGKPDYMSFERPADSAGAEEAGERDELYRKAIEYAAALGEVSISSIQRRLKVGYNRAARMMELMEEDGLVGPPKAAGKPRDFIGGRTMGQRHPSAKPQEPRPPTD